MTSKNIEYIIFDLGGVLVDIYPEQAMQKLAEATPLSPEKISTFFLSDPHLQLMRGEKTFREFYDDFRKEYFFSESFQNFLKTWEDIIGGSRQGMESLVRHLGKTYRIILCSNTDVEHWRICRERCQYIEEYFSKCFLSFEMGLVKPGSEIYQTLLQDLSTKAGSAVFIDDSLENIQSAAALGLHTIHAESYSAITAGLANLNIQYS